MEWDDDDFTMVAIMTAVGLMAGAASVAKVIGGTVIGLALLPFLAPVAAVTVGRKAFGGLRDLGRSHANHKYKQHLKEEERLQLNRRGQAERLKTRLLHTKCKRILRFKGGGVTLLAQPSSQNTRPHSLKTSTMSTASVTASCPKRNSIAARISLTHIAKKIVSAVS
jgi:hypothetical protein